MDFFGCSGHVNSHKCVIPLHPHPHLSQTLRNYQHATTDNSYLLAAYWPGDVSDFLPRLGWRVPCVEGCNHWYLNGQIEEYYRTCLCSCESFPEIFQYRFYSHLLWCSSGQRFTARILYPFCKWWVLREPYYYNILPSPKPESNFRHGLQGTKGDIHALRFNDKHQLLVQATQYHSRQTILIQEAVM